MSPRFSQIAPVLWRHVGTVPGVLRLLYRDCADSGGVNEKLKQRFSSCVLLSLIEFSGQSSMVNGTTFVYVKHVDNGYRCASKRAKHRRFFNFATSTALHMKLLTDIT